MACHNSHQIQIENLCEGEIVQHSILLIKGHVNERCIREDFIRISHVDYCSQPCQVEARVSIKGEFKVLLDMNCMNYSADNTTNISGIRVTFRFRYCNESLELVIVYHPNQTQYSLQPLYIICREDVKPPALNEGVSYTDAEGNIKEACRIIDLNVRLVQSVYAEKIRCEGFQRRTFAINGACRVFQSQLTCEETWKLSELSLWHYFAKEILNSNQWGSKMRHLKFVAFIACTKYDGSAVTASGDFSYANIRRHLKAHAALGGGGLALFGTGYFYAWPEKVDDITNCFLNEERVDISKVPDDSNYRRTYGGVFATTLGAICHEIGHIFDLGHTSNGIMGSGFDYINRVFTVDNLTENLPNRVINEKKLEFERAPVTRPRFTQLKQKTNSFLINYHEQKLNDGFYFTRNCAVILAHHQWFSPFVEEAYVDLTVTHITLDVPSKYVISEEYPIKIIEFRCIENSLVTKYVEFQNSSGKDVYRFQIPDKCFQTLKQTHYLFVLTISGHSRRLYLNAVTNEIDVREACLNPMN